jgi:hypothetical protein
MAVACQSDRDPVRVRGELVHQQPTVLVVDVDQGQAGPIPDEELALGGEVVVEVGVEVEVVAAQVEEDRDVEDDSVDATEHERVAGDLHRARLDLLLDHHREESVQVGRLGSGQRGLDVDAVDPRADRADHGGRDTGGLQRQLREPRGGGLALGAGHGDQPQVVRRLSVDARGERAEHGAGIGHHEDRDTGIADDLRPGHVAPWARVPGSAAYRSPGWMRCVLSERPVISTAAPGSGRPSQAATWASEELCATAGRGSVTRSRYRARSVPHVVSYGAALASVGGTA